MEKSKAFLQIMHNYNISSRTTDTHHPQKNPDEQITQVYKKGTNTLLDQTGATKYLWLYALFIWVLISNCLDEHYHVHFSDYENYFGTTPDISQFILYRLLDPDYYY